MAEPNRNVVLVGMPWALLELPSIPLGILSSVLRAAGIAPIVRSYNLTFLDHLNRTRGPDDEPVTLDDYATLAYASMRNGLADWVFAVPPFRELDPAGDEVFLQRLYDAATLDRRVVDKARRLRDRVPGFIDACVDELLQLRPAIVGFTTTFCQNVSSLVLAKQLKARAPSLCIAFGGANCDGSMGEALFDGFPWVDVVVQGEGEPVVVDLVRDALAGRPIAPRPGVLSRSPQLRALGRRPPVPDHESTRVQLDDIPTPDYDAYFETLATCEFRDELMPAVRIPVETARGCWWGQKNHCTFCGLNGSTMAFRSKSVERALRDFTDLVSRYRCLEFSAVDNIIDLDYLRELLPRLRETGIDLHIFYETKANLTKDQVRTMWESGVRHIQPGIESLSTPILRLMKKGVTAWQNVRLLKWAAQFGIRVDWNVLYGFPGEPEAEYARMATAIASLTHLDPPGVSSVKVQRFSPYHERPAEFGIRLDGPSSHYARVYPAGVRLNDLAYSFDFTFLDGRTPEAYTEPLRGAIAEWHRVRDRNRDALSYRRGPDFIRIVDRREPYGYASYLLEGREAAAYLACDEGATVPAIARELVARGYPSVPHGELEDFLRELVEARLVFESDGRFVSLALPAYRERDAAWRGVAQPPLAAVAAQPDDSAA